MRSLLFVALLTPVAALASEPIPCFPGAIYRKAVSTEADWTGISATVTLPIFTFDPDRMNPKTGRPLDNTSAYLGGSHGEQEIDAGVTWEVVRDRDGKVSRQPGAFRPFWRNDDWANAPAKPEYYYFPGDTLHMRCELVGPEELEMEIVLTARAATSAAAAKAINVDYIDAPTTLTVRFLAPEFTMEGPQEFKRVNAIDQSGNEGLDVQETKAISGGLVWSNVQLLRRKEAIPFTPDVFHDMRCPDPAHVQIRGGIYPNDPTSEATMLVGSPANP